MKRYKVGLLFLLVCTCLACAKPGAVVSEKPDLLFLLSGQSNMHGNGFTADLPDTAEYKAYKSCAANVSVWDAKKKSWKPLEIGDRFGPEIGFGHALSKALPGKHIGLVKFAAGGTSMDKWKPTGRLYQRLVSDLESAKKSVPDAKLAAMLWHQGESDSDSKEVAEAYKAKLIDHIKSIRKDTGEKNLLFILGQINPAKSFVGRVRFLHADIVRKAQQDLYMDNYVMIKTDDCEMNAYIHGAAGTAKEMQIPSKEDNIHYSATGQIKMGARFAEAYLERTNKNSKRPNILFVLIDDMGWKDIGCSGSTYYETPNIDKLAAEGMRFTNAYSAAPVCTPSRGAIFSGKCPARTQLTTVFSGPSGPDDRLHDWSKYRGERDQYIEARNRHALPKVEILIPQALADGGYRTGFFGKWHIGECPGYYPDERGFHVAKGYRVNQHRSSRSHWMKAFVKTAVNLDDADKDAYVADVLTEECVDFITENKDKPWMAVLSHYLVHNPVHPKPEKLERYKNKPTTDQANPGYAWMVESVDDSVGGVLQCLEELGLSDNTMVIFSSDNGGLTLKNTSNYPLMGGKSFPLEAGMKVPFIVKWPGKIKPGISNERIVGMDIYPTMLAAAGIALRPKQHVDGENLMPLLTENIKLKKRPIIFHYPHYTHATGPFSSIIDDDWKLIRFYNDRSGEYLLFNLAVDPEEQKNLAAKEAKMLNRLASKLDTILNEMKAEMPTPNPDYKPDGKGKRFDLKFTKELAEKERERFESLLEKSSK